MPVSPFEGYDADQHAVDHKIAEPQTVRSKMQDRIKISTMSAHQETINAVQAVLRLALRLSVWHYDIDCFT